MKKIEDIFTKTPILLIAGIVAVAVNVIDLIAELVIYKSVSLYCIPVILYIALCADLLVVYKKGETTAQKTLLGSLLTILLYENLKILISNIEGGAPISDIIMAWIATVCYVLVFVNHIFMQHDHKGVRIYSVVNQITLPVLFMVYIFNAITFTVNPFGIFDILWNVSMISILLMIICMETRIQKYKRYRRAKEDAGEWNEETRKKAKKIFSFDIE